MHIRMLLALLCGTLLAPAAQGHDPLDLPGVLKAFGMTLDASRFVVRVDKTAVMDETFKLIRQGRREWPKDINHVLLWVSQMTCPVRKLMETKSGERFVWDRGTSRDDYRQAECYERVAEELMRVSGSFSEVSIR